MSNDDKRFYRNLKKAIKKTGNKKARQFFKKGLEDHPEEAQWDEFDYGHDESATLNGRDGRNRKKNRKKHADSAHGNEPGQESPGSPPGRDED